MALSSCPMTNERVLLREITHRINNEFASVIQVLSVTAARSADNTVKAALAGVTEKLHDYARVHHILQMPDRNECIDASAYLRILCSSISRSKLENRNVELTLLEAPFRMSSERCWMMGMIIAELITNSVRHAFGGQGGAIKVECRVSGAFVECRVSDNGSLSSPSVRPGSGLCIIEALAQRLGADFQFNCDEDGSQAVLTIPFETDRCDGPAPARRVLTSIFLEYE
jgi:two-component sensor histidine kinase